MSRGPAVVGLLAVLGATFALVSIRARDPRPIERSDLDDDRPDATSEAKPPSELAVGPARRPTDAPPAPSAGTPTKRTDGTARITGRILDAEGRPVADAVVRLASAGPTDPSATTDVDGNFMLEVAAGAATEVVVSRPGFADASVAISSLAAGARVAFVKAWVIAGTVRERGTNARIVSIGVRASPITSPESQLPPSTIWREDGTFAVTVPGPGAYVLHVGAGFIGAVMTVNDDFIPTRIDNVAAGTTDVRVTLERGRSIEGEIVDDVGQRLTRPVSIDAVGRTPSGDHDYTTRKIVSSADGTLRVPGLKPGRYDLWIQPSKQAEDANGASVSMTIVRDIAAGTQGLVVRLTRGFVLVGRLQDEAGTAVTGHGYIFAYRAGEMGKSHAAAYGQTLGDGAFRVGPLDDGLRYDLLATGFAGHRAGTTRDVAPRDTGGCVIVLPVGGRISGRVQTADGKPIPAGVPIGVIAEGADVRVAGTRDFGYSAADGTFVVDGLQDLPFTIEAGGGGSGYLGVIVRGVLVGATDLVLHVSVGAELSGTLVDEKGEPVATTSLMADDGVRIAAMRPFAQVGSDGKFLFRGLKAGRVRLSARIGEAWVQAGEVDAPAEIVIAKLAAK